MENIKKNNYWTEQGLASKKANQESKIIKVTNAYKDKKGNERTFIHYRHAGPNDLKFKTNEVRKFTKEEYRLFYKVERDTIKENLDSRPYSRLHNKLVANLYLVPNRLKQQALIAKHEENLKNIREHMKAVRFRQYQEYNRKANNCIEICKKDFKGNEYVFMTLHSNKKLLELKNIATKMVNEITMDTGTDTTANIYSKSTYPLALHVKNIKLAA